MRLRCPPRYGAVSLYRLIASVVAGDAVQPGDADLGDGHGRRDRLLSRYAGTPLPKETPHARQDSPPEPETHPRRG